MSLVKKRYYLLTAEKNSPDGRRDLLIAVVGREDYENVKQNLNEVCERLVKAMMVLTHKEKELLTLHFGLNGGPKKTLTEIRKEFPYSRDSLKVLLSKAILKLRYECSEYILTGKGEDKVIEIIPIQNIPKKKGTKLTRAQLAEIDLEELKLTVLSFNALKRYGINTMLELIEYYANYNEEGIRNIPRVGKKNGDEIIKLLTEYIADHKIKIESYLKLN